MIEINANDLAEKIKLNNDYVRSMADVFVKEAVEACCADANRRIHQIMDPSYTNSVELSDKNGEYFFTRLDFVYDVERFDTAIRNSMKKPVLDALNKELNPCGYRAEMIDIEPEFCYHIRAQGRFYKISWILYTCKPKIVPQIKNEPTENKVYPQKDLKNILRGDQKLTLDYIKSLFKSLNK